MGMKKWDVECPCVHKNKRKGSLHTYQWLLLKKYTLLHAKCALNTTRLKSMGASGQSYHK